MTGRQLTLCKRTMSAHAFYHIVLDAVRVRARLSVVRMGDGEVYLLAGGSGREPVTPPPGHGPEWLDRLGIAGMTWADVQNAIHVAARDCTYFAPSVTGIVDDRFALHDRVAPHAVYVDNFFVNLWGDEMKRELVQAAGHVLLIHGNPHTADSFQLRAQANYGVKVDYIRLTRCQDAADVVAQAKWSAAPLVLFSAGPGGKWIGPAIAAAGSPKVALDLGNAVDQWTGAFGPVNREAAEQFAAEWRARQ